MFRKNCPLSLKGYFIANSVQATRAPTFCITKKVGKNARTQETSMPAAWFKQT